MTLTVGGLVTSYNSPADANYDTPTNPLLTFSGATVDRRFIAIHQDGYGSDPVIDEPILGAGLLTEYSNLHNTDGFTIRCFDNQSSTGINLSTIDLANHNYYVLIHSDDENKYHFAKITEKLSADISGDMFKFSPRLGNEIAKNTKFMVFKETNPVGNIVAIACGLRIEDRKIVVARPMFYFFEDKLDKKGELNHNEKYFIRSQTASSGAQVTLNNADKTTFVTISDYRNKIIDYSKFAMKVKLVDRLKLKDDPDTATSNESTLLGSTYTTLTNYSSCFINARRDTDDNSASLVLSGNKRYVYYNDSPEVNNHMPLVYECHIKDTFDVKSGFSSIELIDSSKSLSSKVFDTDRLKVTQKLSEEDLNEWVEVAELNAYNTVFGNHIYTLTDTKYPNPYLMFGAGIEVKINNRIWICQGSGAGAFAIYDRSRALTGSLFDTSVHPNTLATALDKKVYRRRLNHTDKSILTDTLFSSHKVNKMNAIMISNEYKNYYSPISSMPTDLTDDDFSLSLSFTTNTSIDGIEYLQGTFALNHEVFFGEVEQIEKKINNSMSVFTIEGRNTLSKLVDISLDKNTKFASDIIQTSESPHNKLTNVGQTASWNFDSETITFGANVTLSANAHLWGNDGYIGQLNNSGVANSTTGTLLEKPLTKGTTAVIYYESTKYYPLSKAGGANKEITSVSSLSGTSDKGFHFTAGNSFTGNTLTLTEGSPLVGTSNDTNPLGVGYNIDVVESVDEDLPFLLDINGFSSDTVNALMDFEVLTVKDNNDIKIVKLAPYIPLTLGREELNEVDTSDSGFTDLGLINESGAVNQVTLLTSDINQTKRTRLFNLKIGDPLYIDGVFVGRFLGYSSRLDTNGGSYIAYNSEVFIDRNIPAGQAQTRMLQTSNGKKNRFLHLTNGAHLHSNQMINLIGPNRLPVNYEIDSSFYSASVPTGEDSYSQKFGASIHKVFNLEKGEIGFKKDYLVLESSEGKGRIQPYYEGSIFKYLAQTYKGSPFVSGGLSLTSKTGTVGNIHTPLEQRGFEPITGSNYIDRKFISSNVSWNRLFPYIPSSGYFGVLSTPSVSNPIDNAIMHKDKLYHPDAKAPRLFLYGTTDKRLYTSDRKDSLLSSSSISLESYGLLSINSPRTVNSSVNKTNVVGETSRVSNLDQDYAQSSIISSSKDLSSLKRFGLMRLTDVVMDFAFNIINAEFDVSSSKVVESFPMLATETTVVKGGGSNRTIITHDFNQDIIFNASIDNVDQFDVLFDKTTGYVIGTVASVTTTTVSNDTIVISGVAAGNATRHDGYVPAGQEVGLIKKYWLNPTPTRFLGDIVKVVGRGEQETILFPVNTALANNSKGNDIHMLKGVFAGEDSPSDWIAHYRHEADGNNNSAANTTTRRALRKGTNHGIMSVILPIGFQGLSFLHPTDIGFGTRPDGFIQYNTSIGAGSTAFDEFDTFDVTKRTTNLEQSEFISFLNGLDLGEGSNTSNNHLRDLLKAVNLKPMSSEGNDNSKQGQTSPFLNKATLGAVFKSFNSTDSNGNMLVYPAYTTTEEYGISNTDVAGVYLGFKPHLKLSSVSNDSVKGIKGTTLYKNSFTTTESTRIIKNLDLTGCYLVPAEEGTFYDGEGTTNSSSVASNHQLTPEDNKIIYVVSHEYDISNTGTDDKCVLLTDEGLEVNKMYKIMQPNPICFWDKSPKKIRLNTLSSEYTKSMDKDEMLSPPSAWEQKPTTVGTRENKSNSEGVQSMYVIVDMDNLSGENNTIVKTKAGLNNVLTGIKGEFNISDGNNNIVVSMKSEIIDDDIGKYLEISSMRKIDGVASVSETFELTVNGDITNDANRALIGTTIDISKEVENTIEELLIENDIDFVLTKENYSIFTSPNFQGTSLFNIVKYLLSLKNKKMVDVSGTIQIVSEDDSAYISKYYFTDDDIVEIEVEKSKFGYANDITLYGNKHKAVRKSPREIKKRGKKSLNIFDEKLTTQESVDDEASRLLAIHSSINNVVSFDVESSKVKTITVGDIVELESKAAGLERFRYLVLEMTHSFAGKINFKVGRYIEGLEDTLTKLITDSKDTKSYLRNQEFNVNDSAFDFFDEVNIKEMHLLIRKRHQSGSSLGFTTTLNTNTNPLGFSGGVITITKLIEEDL